MSRINLAPPHPCGCVSYAHREVWHTLCEAHAATYKELHAQARADRTRAELVGPDFSGDFTYSRNGRAM